MSTRTLLVELLVEELPPKALKKLGLAFASGLHDALRAQGLASEHSAHVPYATPRRLAVQISAVREQAADRAVAHKLMPASVGLDAHGQPTPALLKKLAALGVDAAAVSALRRQHDGKAETLYIDSIATGVTLRAGLQHALGVALEALPIPKLMQYQLAQGEGADFQPGWTSVQFVRPAHGLVALHGAEVVPVTALGLNSGRQTLGHRFEAPMTPVMLLDAAHYARQLDEQGAVMASFDARQAEILRQLHAAAAKEGLAPIQDAALLDEVTALVERPNVLLCRFEPEFLAVPQECLILTMKANQKYFPLLDAQGNLTNRFLVVSNVTPDDPRRVIEGNERVVRPRLADARFFFDQDRRTPLASRVEGLSRVVYHHKLGSQGERVERVRAIARSIGLQLGGSVLCEQADQAAMLAKADLLTDMVGEFPELQGTMGSYYARHDGLGEQVAFAIEDHYRPRYAGDALPRHPTGVVVALADKLETLVGLFGIGQLPSGDRDPFALRRHALGVVRMLVERGLPLDVDALVAQAAGCFGARVADPRQTAAAVLEFLFDRLAVGLRDQGYSAHEVDAVLARRSMRLSEVPRALAAVRAFAVLPEAGGLASANKRVANILAKSAPDAGHSLRSDAFTQPQEHALFNALAEVGVRADAAHASGDYTAELQALAALKSPVDAFFDAVMVNVDDAALRANRLGLLARLHQAMNRVADLSKLAA